MAQDNKVFKMMRRNIYDLVSKIAGRDITVEEQTAVRELVKAYDGVKEISQQAYIDQMEKALRIRKEARRARWKEAHNIK